VAISLVIYASFHYGTVKPSTKPFAFGAILLNLPKLLQPMAVPYAESPECKKKQVASMFDNIARWYDFLNHFLTLGIDVIWRRKAAACLVQAGAQKVLDVATGTADLAIEASKQGVGYVVGVDISKEMLAIGKNKIEKKQLCHKITLQDGDSEKLIFPDSYFDAVSCAFGVRNFENLQAGLSEIHRVIRPGGKFVMLEFSKPSAFPIKQLYNFYFTSVLPLMGRLFSKDKSAYTYLPQSVQEFPCGSEFTAILKKTGFSSTKARSLSFGIATIYVASK
jgi:demethylmenaquinone methyltransferase / 2-methoxy-6-polyprenyl-1,4-benzoquinol methylase